MVKRILMAILIFSVFNIFGCTADETAQNTEEKTPAVLMSAAAQQNKLYFFENKSGEENPQGLYRTLQEKSLDDFSARDIYNAQTMGDIEIIGNRLYFLADSALYSTDLTDYSVTEEAHIDGLDLPYDYPYVCTEGSRIFSLNENMYVQYKGIYKISGGAADKIADDIFSVDVSDDWAYYSVNGNIVRSRLDGDTEPILSQDELEQKLNEAYPDYYNWHSTAIGLTMEYGIIKDGGNLYFLLYNGDGGHVFKYEIDGGELTCIYMDSTVRSFTVYNDTVYCYGLWSEPLNDSYILNSFANVIFKTDISSGETSLIRSDVKGAVISGGKMYFDVVGRDKDIEVGEL